MPKDGYIQISVSLKQEEAPLKKALERAAKAKHQSASQWVLWAIRKALGREAAK